MNLRCRLFYEECARRPEDAHVRKHHDDSCNDDANHHRKRRLLEVHVEQACRKGAGPCAGAGKRYSNEECERDEQTVSCLRLELRPCLRALVKKEGAYLANEFLVLPPFEHFAREQVDRSEEHTSEL